MALKTYNPITPSQRELVQVDRSGLWKGGPVKALTEGLTKSGGRNNYGRITARRHGGGHKRRYRTIDFKRTKFDIVGTVERLEYDPNRTAFIALINYTDGEQVYILAPQRLKAGDKVVAGEKNGHQARQCYAAEKHPDRHHHPQCGNEAGQRRPDRSLGRWLRPVGRQGFRLRPVETSLR